MDDVHRVFIVGDSLFAETLRRTLAGSGTVTISGVASTVESAMALIGQTEQLDAVIVTGADDRFSAAFGPLFTAYPDLSFIGADLSTDSLILVTVHQIKARTADLLDAISVLPKREVDVKQRDPESS